MDPNNAGYEHQLTAARAALTKSGIAKECMFAGRDYLLPDGYSLADGILILAEQRDDTMYRFAGLQAAYQEEIQRRRDAEQKVHDQGRVIFDLALQAKGYQSKYEAGLAARDRVVRERDYFHRVSETQMDLCDAAHARVKELEAENHELQESIDVADSKILEKPFLERIAELEAELEHRQEEYKILSDDNELLEAERNRLLPCLDACKEFVRKVECGEAWSRRSYAQMKAACVAATTREPTEPTDEQNAASENQQQPNSAQLAQTAERASERVATWPEWKQQISVSGKQPATEDHATHGIAQALMHVSVRPAVPEEPSDTEMLDWLDSASADVRYTGDDLDLCTVKGWRSATNTLSVGAGTGIRGAIRAATKGDGE